MPAKLDKESQLERVAEGLKNLFADPSGALTRQTARALHDPSMQALPMGMGFNLPQFRGIVNALSGRAALPLPENIASWLGGARFNTPAGTAAKLSETTMEDLARIYETDPGRAAKIAEAVWKPHRQGAQRVTSTEFRPQATAQAGGARPPQDVMDRVMNAGLRDKLLGFGAGVPAMALPPLLRGEQEQGGRHDLLSRLLGIDYPGYVIQQGPNVGNTSEREQLRQLGFGQ